MKSLLSILAWLITSTAFGVSATSDTATLVSSVTAATVRIDSAADLSSGVIVSQDGYVLTVAHGLSRQESVVTVRFSDGASAKANVVFQDPTSDVALLKIVDVGQRTLVAIPLAIDGVSEGTAVLAFGHPARDTTACPAVVRLGKVVRTHANSIRSTCVLTAGDSGGPLVTSDGRLIGIHQRIGAVRTTNLHVSIAACCTALKETVDLRNLPQVPPIGTALEVKSPLPNNTNWQRHAVQILDQQQQVVAWGTVVNGRTVVTKLSLLKPKATLQVRRFGGVAQPCELVAQHRSDDLAVLRLSAVTDVAPITAGANVRTGEVVHGTEAGVPGIVAKIDHEEPSARGRLGCTLSVVAADLVVERVSADSAASDAGLQPGDHLLQLLGKKAQQLSAVGAVMQTLQPGDWMSFGVRRAGVQHNSFGQLRHPSADLLNRSEFLDGRSGQLSLRRSAFAVTVQHDLPLTAIQLGGPLLAADGRIIGINIAVRAREAVLALPISHVLETCPDIGQ